MKHIRSSLMAGLLGLGLSAAAAWADTTIRLGTVVPATSLQGQATDLFAEKVNAAGVGLDIRIFPAAQLGGADVQMQNVKQGIQDAIIEDMSWLSTFSDTMRIAVAPFMFRDADHMAKWIKSPAFDSIHADMLKQGNQIVYFGDNLWLRGPYRVIMSNKPVNTLDELKTARLRMYANEIVQRFWGPEGFGANTITVAWSEVYLAMSQGTVDAFTGPIDQITPMRFGEVAKYIARTDETPQILGLSVNADTWGKLNDAQKDAIHAAWNEAGAFLAEKLNAQADGWIEELKAQGVTVETFDRAAFVARAAEITDALIADGTWKADVIAGIRDIH